MRFHLELGLNPARLASDNPSGVTLAEQQTVPSMAGAFSRRRHRQSAISLWYQTKLRRSPFLFFGLPFLSIIVGGSFALTNFATIRYERHDQKVKIMTEEEMLKLDKDRRRPNIREEYYVCFPRLLTDIATAGEGFGQLGAEACNKIKRYEHQKDDC
jgi:cytochrome c oxidase assembly protein subunit 16